MKEFIQTLAALIIVLCVAALIQGCSSKRLMRDCEHLRDIYWECGEL